MKTQNTSFPFARLLLLTDFYHCKNRISTPSPSTTPNAKLLLNNPTIHAVPILLIGTLSYKLPTKNNNNNWYEQQQQKKVCNFFPQKETHKSGSQFLLDIDSRMKLWIVLHSSHACILKSSIFFQNPSTLVPGLLFI